MIEVPEIPEPPPDQADMQTRLEFWLNFHEAGGSIGAVDWLRLPPLDQAALMKTGRIFRDLQAQRILDGLREIMGQKIEKVDPVQEAARAALKEMR